MLGVFVIFYLGYRANGIAKSVAEFDKRRITDGQRELILDIYKELAAARSHSLREGFVARETLARVFDVQETINLILPENFERRLREGIIGPMIENFNCHNQLFNGNGQPQYFADPNKRERVLGEYSSSLEKIIEFNLLSGFSNILLLSKTIFDDEG